MDRALQYVESKVTANRIESMEIECTVSSSRMDAIDTKSVLWVCVCFVALPQTDGKLLAAMAGPRYLGLADGKVQECLFLQVMCVEGQNDQLGIPANGTSCPLTLLEI